MLSFSIAPLRAEHLDRLAELEEKCFPDPWSRALLLDMIAREDAVSLAAVDADGLVLGYASYRRVLDEGSVDSVAVDPAFRRRGIAGALLEALEASARETGLRSLTLEVRASNAAARALYAGAGYVPVGRRRGYYIRPAEDAVLMTLTL